MTIHLANPRRLAYGAVADVWTPPPPVDYEAWAVANIVFSERESPTFKGPFNPRNFPFFTEIYRALGPSDPCRIVTIKKSAQCGGTILANVFTLGSQALDPSDFLYCHPTEDNARRWSKIKLKQMLRGTTALADVFPEKSRDGADNILFKERADGRGAILISGANSPASLSQVTMPKQVQDDLSKWEMNAAGDPESQADSRSQACEFAKVLKISTPLVMPGCRITKNYEQGSQEQFYFPCPHCGHEQTLELENFLDNLDEDEPERSHFVCAECGCAIEEHHRPAMLLKGRWIAKNPKAARYHRSFDIWSAYSLLQSFERIARAWLSAKGDPKKEQVFYNDVAGRAYQVKGEAPPWEALRKRADENGHKRGVVPAWAFVVTVGVDVQDGWLAWQAVAWGREGRRAVIDYRHIKDAAIDTPTSSHPRLDELLASKWRGETGREFGVDMLAIDGNYMTEEVWGWAKRHPVSKVIMVRGVDGDDKPLLARVKKERNRKTGKLLRYSSRFYHFASWVMKWALYRHLAKDDPLTYGFVAFPKEMGDDFFQELTAEHRVLKKGKGGEVRYVWEVQDGQRNEGLDTMLQAEAAAIKFGVRDMAPGRWDQIERERAAPPDQGQLDIEDMLTPAAAPVAPEPPSETEQDDTPSPPPAPPPAQKPRRAMADFAASLNRK
ncbi:phage terminase large subunit GpA-like protein [Rhodoblastus acidophilus]|uniref:phage terminase large subunit family protein n=1 Tax=Rhodoblastus acidophilus TaxID=1074 RepID=UPI00222598AE|nr:phage terminase large subunit family protein [Rhodoblastus acidophilus]MCW2319196.1 phage terminase large subunit GpA-like protein [Rhodoblastus acidophilus]